MKNRPMKIAACCMAGTLLAAAPVYAASAETAPRHADSGVEQEGSTASIAAGISLELSNYLENAVAAQASGADASAGQASGKKKASEEKETASKSSNEKESKYDNMAVSQVSDYVNIRRKPNENSRLLGKLYSNSVAEVLKKKGDWYKIKSGTVTGYVKGDYIVVGDEKLVKSVGVQSATVKTTTLKVRSKASVKSEVITLVPDGEVLAVSSMKKYDDGWVKVDLDDGQGYVSSDYVKVTTDYTYAESREEEAARLAEEQAAESQAGAGAADNGEAGEDAASQADSGSAGAYSPEAEDGSAASQADNGSSAPSQGAVSSSGQAVADYACQFVGNPYVYGGSSLTNGADCSGFVMSVYAHFGISLPHSSDALAGVGYGVSYDSMQPGDIIVYSGHCAIYIGNNSIVHASNSVDGIKYSSPADYRSIIAVRRIF